MSEKLEQILREKFGKNLKEATKEEIYFSLLAATKDEIKLREENVGNKKVYYISSEFLIGKLLSNNLINLGKYDEIKNLLSENSISLSEIEELELEPSLGNGGLGRLAACFVDSIATLGINGAGIGILYHCGLFKQYFENNSQISKPDFWIEKENWLNKTETLFPIQFNNFKVLARLYEIDVLGYNNGKIKLNLFDLEDVNEKIISEGINFDKKLINENLSLFLYPDDSDEDGHLLRIYQQHFMVSSGAQLILKELKEKNIDLDNIEDHVVIQINDTHPTLIIPEMIYQLTQNGIHYETAIEKVMTMVAYTNHTILAEALEKWPLKYLETVVPHLLKIIVDLDNKFKEINNKDSINIIDSNGIIHMARLAIHCGFSVNGVAKLHTNILINNELKDFASLYPNKFNNKTNGITFRRWLLSCNPDLANLISNTIGTNYLSDADELKKLLNYTKDEAFLNKLEEVKKKNKKNLVTFIKKNRGIEIDENSIFDIQVKRLHEYKRQQMNLLYIIYKYLDIKSGNIPKTPITFILGAKAAPAYTIAQDIIHLALCLEQLINNDVDVNKHIKIVMIQNYNVEAAEKLIPACDVSEQISIASKEASGTGNMKFMLNGAVTIGTLDGANVEIADLVGDDNIFIFGKKSEVVLNLYRNNSYVAMDYYNKKEIKKLVDFINGDELKIIGDINKLNQLHHEIISKDYFMTLLDLEEYIITRDKIFESYENKKSWNQKSLTNIAHAGYFSSDRTIKQYNDEIWNSK